MGHETTISHHFLNSPPPSSPSTKSSCPAFDFDFLCDYMTYFAYFSNEIAFISTTPHADKLSIQRCPCPVLLQPWKCLTINSSSLDLNHCCKATNCWITWSSTEPQLALYSHPQLVEKEGPVPTAATTQQLYQSFYKSLGDQLAGQWDRWRRREEAGKETVMCAAK